MCCALGNLNNFNHIPKCWLKAKGQRTTLSLKVCHQRHSKQPKQQQIAHSGYTGAGSFRHENLSPWPLPVNIVKTQASTATGPRFKRQLLYESMGCLNGQQSLRLLRAYRLKTQDVSKLLSMTKGLSRDIIIDVERKKRISRSTKRINSIIQTYIF